jgi:hypothetical protein
LAQKGKIMKISKIFLLLFIALLLSCEPSYKKENGNWAWVSKYSAAGKFVREFSPHDSTFEILENRKYAKDKDSVYLEGISIKNADPNTFEVLSSNGYSKDKDNVFLDTDIVIFANPKTFEIIEWPFARDDQRIFNGNLPMDVSDIESFKITRSGNSRIATVKYFFIECNEDYSWLDTMDVQGIIVGGDAEAVAENEKFEGFRKVE